MNFLKTQVELRFHSNLHMADLGQQVLVNVPKRLLLQQKYECVKCKFNLNKNDFNRKGRAAF